MDLSSRAPLAPLPQYTLACQGHGLPSLSDGKSIYLRPKEAPHLEEKNDFGITDYLLIVKLYQGVALCGKMFYMGESGSYIIAIMLYSQTTCGSWDGRRGWSGMLLLLHN